jgi:hypothetical protein
MVAMGQRSGGNPETGWAAMRPVLVAFLLVADAFAIGSLAIARPEDWLAPFLAFGTVLVGLMWFQIWTIRRRHDDD